MMLWEYILDNLLPIGVAIGGAIAWVVDKNRRKAELKSVMIQNKQHESTALQGMQDVYDKFVDDVKSQLDELRIENQKLRERLNELEDELIKAENAGKELMQQVENFKKQSESDAKLIAQLKKKIESYEQELKAFRKERL